MCVCVYVNTLCYILGSCLFGQGEILLRWVFESQAVCLRLMHPRVQLDDEERFQNGGGGRHVFSQVNTVFIGIA